MPSLFSNAALPLITMSAFLYDWPTIVSKPAFIVSVRTYVPLIIATPSTIAIAVNDARNLRPARPLRATANI